MSKDSSSLPTGSSQNTKGERTVLNILFPNSPDKGAPALPGEREGGTGQEARPVKPVEVLPTETWHEGEFHPPPTESSIPILDGFFHLQCQKQCQEVLIKVHCEDDGI